MVRLVPTADPEILLLAPAVQLAQPAEQAKGKSLDPSKKKPATKKVIKESSTSLQHGARRPYSSACRRARVSFPSSKPGMLHGELGSLPVHQGMTTSLRAD